MGLNCHSSLLPAEALWKHNHLCAGLFAMPVHRLHACRGDAQSGQDRGLYSLAKHMTDKAQPAVRAWVPCWRRFDPGEVESRWLSMARKASAYLALVSVFGLLLVVAEQRRSCCPSSPAHRQALQ